MEWLDPGRAVAQPKQLGLPHVPGGDVRQRPAALVFGLYASPAMGSRRGPGGYPVTGLDAGFLVGADDVLVPCQRSPLPDPLIEVQDRARPLCEAGITRKNPAAMRPGLDGVGIQPTPHRRPADGGNDPMPDGLAGNVGVAETGQRQTPLARHLTGQRLNFHDDLRGKNGVVAHVPAGFADRAGVRRKIAFATC